MNCPKCAAPLQAVHLPNDVDIETCPHCSGAFYDAAEIAIPLQVENLTRSGYVCPKCQDQMKVGTLYNGQLTLEQCMGCQGVWFDAGEIQKLRKLSGVEGVIGSPGAADPAAPLFPAAAFAAFMAENTAAKPSSSGGPSSKKKGPAKSEDDGDSPVEPPDGSSMDNPDSYSGPVLTYEGRQYRHFQTSAPVVSYVLGEFNWKVAVGDKGRARDFICPPYLLSEDVSDGDSVWSHGEYIEPEEVWKAFSLEGNPPPRSGVAPAQPNPFAESFSAVNGAFWIYFAACIGLFVFLSSIAQKRPVFNGTFQYSSSDPEKSRVTDLFEVGGHTANLKIQTVTNLDNHWSYFSMALINADTDEALDFGREVSYYHGYDDGESWSEGKSYDTVYLPRVKPGRYYLRIEPETDIGAFQYSVGITRDVPRVMFLFLALGLLTLPMLWFWWRNRNFEYARWLESDHPIAPLIKSSSDDDD